MQALRGSSPCSTFYREIKTWDLRLVCNELLPANLPHTALHHPSPRPAPSASLTQSQNCQVSSPSFLPSPNSRLRCLPSYLSWVALGTQQQHPLPLLSSYSLTRLNLLSCFLRHSSITKGRLVAGADRLWYSTLLHQVGVRPDNLPRRDPAREAACHTCFSPTRTSPKSTGICLLRLSVEHCY